MSDTFLDSEKIPSIPEEPELPKQELDEPFSPVPKLDEMSTLKLEIREKDQVRKEKRYFSALGLIIGCLSLLLIIYGVEVYISYKSGMGPSSHTDGIIEIIKTLLFTLSGYLFARKENNS